MKYVDKSGKEMDISYSTEVQQKLEKTLRETLKWRIKIYKALNAIKWLMLIMIILAVFAYFYLDSRNVFSFIGKGLFC